MSAAAGQANSSGNGVPRKPRYYVSCPRITRQDRSKTWVPPSQPRFGQQTDGPPVEIGRPAAEGFSWPRIGIRGL